MNPMIPHRDTLQLSPGKPLGHPPFCQQSAIPQQEFPNRLSLAADLPTDHRSLTCKNSVELRGFEPLTPSMRTRCATGLRYSPENLS